jgi:GTP-binding protein
MHNSEMAMEHVEPVTAAPAPQAGGALPTVVILGRPNVGKSTLFNKLTGTRRAIVGDEPGITRDRLYGHAEWRGRAFRLADTGGIVPDEQGLIPTHILRQAHAAIEEASLILLVVDTRAGITPLDEELAMLVRRARKPVFVVANKVDTAQLAADAAEFARWGFDRVFPLSAEHGHGVADLLDAALAILPVAEAREGQQGAIALSVIGRPNVGKSSLVNRLTGEERVIVSPLPGTTRDAIDTEMAFEGTHFRLIDTAGMQRQGRTASEADTLAVMMARRHLERADVAILLLDALTGPTAFDAHIAGYAHDAGTSLIVAVNKWDAVAHEPGTRQQYERRIRALMKFADYAPIVFISAKTGLRVTQLLALARRASQERQKRVPTAELNRFWEAHLAQPHATTPTRSPIRVLYMTQASVSPPTFVLFTSARGPHAKLHFSYERYIKNRLRDAFGFFATPIRIKQRGKKGNGPPG